jgi:ABC-type Mn2+/Zn2+ transport system permease subunit
MIAVVSSLFGILIAHPLNIPASASIVMMYTLIFILSFFIKKGGQIS